MALLTAHAFGGSAILVRPTEMHRDDLSTEAARGEIQRTVKNDISFHRRGTGGPGQEEREREREQGVQTARCSAAVILRVDATVYLLLMSLTACTHVSKSLMPYGICFGIKFIQI